MEEATNRECAVRAERYRADDDAFLATASSKQKAGAKKAKCVGRGNDARLGSLAAASPRSPRAPPWSRAPLSALPPPLSHRSRQAAAASCFARGVFAPQ
ncbi:hypothetical protein MTO96_013631 [Rhipicephalus appendiculatus]